MIHFQCLTIKIMVFKMKYFKIIALTIAISLLLTFFGTAKIKAEPVTATLAAATAVVVGGVIISTLVNELGQQLSRIDMEAQQQGAYDQTVFNASVANAQKIQEAYFNEIASELPESSLDKYQIAQSIFDPNKYLSYAGVSYPSELSPDDRLVYYALSNAYSKVNSFYIDEANQGLKLSSDDYIDMLHASVSEAYEAFSGIPLDFSLGNGLGIALLNIPIPSVLFPNLKSQYNFLNCYKPLSGFSKNASGYNFLVDSFSGTHYFVGVYDVKNSIFKKPFPASYVSISPFSSGHYKTSFQSFGIRIDWNYSFIVDTVGIFQYENSENLQSTSLGLATFTPFRDYPMNYDNHIGDLKLQTTFDDCYLFEFTTEEEAQSFIDGISVDTTYDPSKDLPEETESSGLVLSPGLSDVEKSIAAKQSELGVTDVDVGFTADGVTVDDTNVADIDISQSLDISDTIEKFKTPNSITTKFPFSLPFDIYHVFNILSAEPKTPCFHIPIDFSSIGGQVYNIDIDLSDYDFIANIVRWLLYGAFLVGLIILTNKLIGRG